MLSVVDFFVLRSGKGDFVDSDNNGDFAPSKLILINNDDGVDPPCPETVYY